ncbi:MAG TPA: biopolymer transporter ExbD, partial [Steroidobacteraceae bacterium]
MNTLAEPQMNATPLIDVLLVLLVMLIFTLPMATHAVKLNLPQRDALPPSAPVTVQIDFDGQLYWNGEAMSAGEMEPRFRAVAAAANQPPVKVIPDKRVQYELVAQVLAAAQRSG